MKEWTYFEDEAKVSRSRDESSFVRRLGLVLQNAIFVGSHDRVANAEQGEKAMTVLIACSDIGDELAVVELEC